MFKNILDNLKNNSPLVHCITNYVTVNDCANILLACGGSPIMADDQREVEEITSLCNALAINIGTLNERTIQAMIKAGQAANAINHPVVLDPVGAGASKLRTDTTLDLMKKIQFSVIRGNISEIKTIADGSGRTKGVDADINDQITIDNLQNAIDFAKGLSLETKSIIAITGAIDIVASPEKAYIIGNGHPMMSKVTGTGCMLTALIAAFCGATPSEPLDATAAAVCVMGYCGERAFEKLQLIKGGTSSYRSLLIDEVSKIEYDALSGGMKVEIR